MEKKSKIEIHIRDVVATYVDNRLSTKEFWSMISELAWSIKSFDDPAAEDLVYEAVILVSEFHKNHRDEESLKQELGIL